MSRPLPCGASMSARRIVAMFQQVLCSKAGAFLEVRSCLALLSTASGSG